MEKRLPNAFSGTELHDLLQNHGRLDLIVCGFMTHSSVSTTVRAAKDYGYRCTLADSACATRDIPTLNGGVLSAADLQRAEIAALGDNFAAIVAQARNCSDRPSSRPPVPPLRRTSLPAGPWLAARRRVAHGLPTAPGIREPGRKVPVLAPMTPRKSG